MTHRPRSIGIIHYQVGRTDGVSLEIEKPKRAFGEIGTLTESLGSDPLLRVHWQEKVKGTRT